MGSISNVWGVVKMPESPKLLMNVRISAETPSVLKAVADLADSQSFRMHGVQFSPVGYRTPESAVLVAVVAAAGGALGAIINGALGIAQRSKGRAIVIQDSHGRRIEFPADLPSERVEEILKLLAKVDTVTLYLP